MLAKDVTGCIFENINTHDNGGIGFYLGGNSTDNLLLNIDSHHNADPYTTSDPYGAADGFHVRVEYPNTTKRFIRLPCME